MVNLIPLIDDLGQPLAKYLRDPGGPAGRQVKDQRDADNHLNLTPEDKVKLARKLLGRD